MMRYSVLIVLANLAAPVAAQFTVLSGPCDFGAVQVVGETPWNPALPTKLGFDLHPDGTTVATPFPVTSALSTSVPLTTTFQSVGVLLGIDDVAVSQPSNPAGIGVMSPANTLAGSAAVGWTAPVDIQFVDPVSGAPSTVPAAGIWTVDGPVNDTSIEFRDGTGATIAIIHSTTVLSFVGIAAAAGIGSMTISTSAPDDFFVEDLYYGVAAFAGGLVSSEVTRTGTPANPVALLPGQTSGPVIGATWDPVIDHSSFMPGAVFDLFALGTGTANLPFSPLGTILCSGLAGAPLLGVAGVPFAIPIPESCNLMGLSFCTQGLSTDGVALTLTNALDITIGNL
tara:strand:+ start:12920 stop:13939 length:1020 start_codon:yes stop_codon:yes gene_type:complete